MKKLLALFVSIGVLSGSQVIAKDLISMTKNAEDTMTQATYKMENKTSEIEAKKAEMKAKQEAKKAEMKAKQEAKKAEKQKAVEDLKNSAENMKKALMK